MKQDHRRERRSSSQNSRSRHKHKKYQSEKGSKYRRQRSQSQKQQRRKHQRQNYRQDKRRKHQHDEKYKEKKQQYKPKEEIVKEKPCWQPSGILLQFYNSREGVSLKFNEPPESRRPIDVWKMYIFKGEEVLKPITLQNSCYLIGKDERICDILCENPSISRQHAVIQFRMSMISDQQGNLSEVIKPYIIDLQSTNGTILNDEKVPSSRYVQLMHKDVLKFGFSDREYVLVRDIDAERQRRHNDDM